MTKDKRGSRFFLVRDIERCPYLPKDPGYEKWERDDIERANKIIDAREKMWIDAHKYLNHEDRIIRNMALFIVGFFAEK